MRAVKSVDGGNPSEVYGVPVPGGAPLKSPDARLEMRESCPTVQASLSRQ